MSTQSLTPHVDPWQAALQDVEVDPVPLTEVIERLIATTPSIQSDKTRNNYRSVAALFGEHLGRPATTADLTEETVGGWFRRRGGEVKPNTVNGEASTMLALWRWCALRGMAPPATLAPPPRQSGEPRALSLKQLKALFATAERTSQVVGDVPGSLYWPALLIVLWQTAERVGAVRALRWEDIDLEGGWVRYPAGTRKGGTRELLRPISSVAIARLRALQEVAPQSPFGAESTTAWYFLWHALTAEAGLPKWVSPHTFRKSVASHLLSLDDACEMLGHGSSKTTKKHYRDPRMGSGRKLLDKLPKIDGRAGIIGRLLSIGRG